MAEYALVVFLVAILLMGAFVYLEGGIDRSVNNTTRIIQNVPHNTPSA
jgi:Flp pilus assembly pilin Flp